MAPELHDPKAFGLERPRSYASDVYAFACVCIEVNTVIVLVIIHYADAAATLYG